MTCWFSWVIECFFCSYLFYSHGVIFYSFERNRLRVIWYILPLPKPPWYSSVLKVLVIIGLIFICAYLLDNHNPEVHIHIPLYVVVLRHIRHKYFSAIICHSWLLHVLYSFIMQKTLSIWFCAYPPKSQINIRCSIWFYIDDNAYQYHYPKST